MLAAEMKQVGNKLNKSKEYRLAKRVYTNAIKIAPSSCASLKRDLLSNRSYMNELLGDYDGALSDATKCEKLFPNWPKVWTLLAYYSNSLFHFMDCCPLQ